MRGMAHSVIVWKACARTPLWKLWRKQKGEVAVCLHLFHVGTKRNEVAHNFEPNMRAVPKASLASLSSFSDFELCLWLQENKTLDNGYSGQGVWRVENQPVSSCLCCKKTQVCISLSKGFFLFTRVREAGQRKILHQEAEMTEVWDEWWFQLPELRSNLLRDRHKHFNWSS